MSRRRCNHGGGQLWPGGRAARPRFTITAWQVDGDAWVGAVLNATTAALVHETEPQPQELDARVLAGLWLETHEMSLEVK